MDRMEVVGIAASASQLAVYIHAAATYLHHLRKIFKSATFSVRSQLEDLDILLKILDHIKSHHSPSDTIILVPVLIRIADAAQKVSIWFDQASPIRQRWILILRGADIEEAFRLLRQKCDLLILYHSEQNNRLLRRIESSLHSQYLETASSSESMSSSESISLSESMDLSENMDLCESTGSSEKKNGVLDVKDTVEPRLPKSTSHRDSAFDTFFVQRTEYSSFHRQPKPPKPPKQSPEREQNGHSYTSIVSSGNRCFNANVKIFDNSYRPNRDFEGEYNDNDVCGGSINVGNDEARRLR